MFKERICPCQLKKYDGLKIVEHGKCVGISSLGLKITNADSFFLFYIHTLHTDRYKLIPEQQLGGKGVRVQSLTMQRKEFSSFFFLENLKPS